MYVTIQVLPVMMTREAHQATTPTDILSILVLMGCMTSQKVLSTTQQDLSVVNLYCLWLIACVVAPFVDHLATVFPAFIHLIHGRKLQFKIMEIDLI